MHVVTTESAPDWAEELAKTIAHDLRAVFYNPTDIALVVARLRKVKLEGERDGIRQAADAIRDTIELHKDETEPKLEVLPMGPGLNA